MKNNVPLMYWSFRMAWTLLHFLIVAAATAALLIWALTDQHAVRAFEPARDNVLNLQQRVSRVIPWPWATDGDHAVGSQTPQGQPAVQVSSPQTATPSQSNSNQAAGGEYQVIGDVNVRAAPLLDAKVVKTVADGSWVTIDCITQGPSVDPGPYKTKLPQYQGQDYKPTSNGTMSLVLDTFPMPTFQPRTAVVCQHAEGRVEEHRDRSRDYLFVRYPSRP